MEPLVSFTKSSYAFCASSSERITSASIALRLDGTVSILHKVLICLLRVFFRTNHFSFHCLGIIDDLLNHSHDASCSGILLVRLEAWRWRRTSWLIDLHE